MSTERILPRIIFVNWRVKLILKQWQLGILEQGMNSSDGNKLTSRRNGRSTTSISWYSFWKYSKVGRIEERSGIWTRWIFDKKTGRKSVQRLRLCTQWIYISRSKSTSVISSSSWTRRIANSRLQIAAKHMGYAWYIGKRFCISTSVLFDNLFRNAQSLDFSITGNIPVQASTGRPVIENGDRDNSHSRAPKWLKTDTISQFSFLFFLISEETVDWNSNALPEEESRSLGFQWNARRKIYEERLQRKDRVRSPFEKQSQPQCWLEW